MRYQPERLQNGRHSVQPPIAYLENMFTIRIHLDDTDELNGALRVFPGSHQNGIIRTAEMNTYNEAVTCPVAAGGIMIMKPLMLHSSGRTANRQRRRVIHIEFSNMTLPHPLEWAESLRIPA